MRLFQNSGIHSSYRHRLDQLSTGDVDFESRRRTLVNDRFGALHFLKPALDGDSDAFFTNGDDAKLQHAWARQRGMSERGLEEILLAQIEEHRTEVFYNTDPTRFDSAFVRRLPACVKKTICWRAAPLAGADLSAYGIVVCNFPSILADWQRRGWRTAYFSPAIDPVMDEYLDRDRTIDILFVGAYTRHHSMRVKVLEAVAALGQKFNVVYCLDVSRLNRVAETPAGLFIPQLRKLRRPAAVRSVAKPAVFGRDLYDLIGRAKIVLNGAIDMAGRDRGNMRCFEAMGCGALLLSDAGEYPKGMRDRETMVAYEGAEQAVQLALNFLSDDEKRNSISTEGRDTVRKLYNKSAQWALFTEIVSSI